jgi:sulfatase modifying factor 1
LDLILYVWFVTNKRGLLMRTFSEEGYFSENPNNMNKQSKPMKNQFKPLLLTLAMMACIGRTEGQPVITSFSQNGVLVCSNLNPGTTWTVQGSQTPGSESWSNLYSATAGSNNTIQVIVSTNVQAMFYRVMGPVVDNTGSPSGMALIPAGWFTMGDTLDGESDAAPTNIYVSQFYMDTNLVCCRLYQSVFNYATNQGYSFELPPSGIAANYPVFAVNWYDCLKWCNARSAQAGLTPVYYTDAGLTQVYTNGDVDLTISNVNWSANGYRLPTEAEWEKAARGGLSGQRFPWGLTINESQANYIADPLSLNSGGYSYDVNSYGGYDTNFDTGGFLYTSPVGCFAANGYELNDMAGNVEEWCWDWYGIPYGQPTANNPTGPSSSPNGSRVFRGGDWDDNANVARCADREFINPTYGILYDLGFRCVRGH